MSRNNAYWYYAAVHCRGHCTLVLEEAAKVFIVLAISRHHVSGRFLRLVIADLSIFLFKHTFSILKF
jgi:hypothetical protein